MNTTSGDRWIIGVSGASGTVYARRLISALVLGVPGIQLDVVITDAAFRVFQEEESLFLSQRNASSEGLLGFPGSQLTFHNNRDIGASIASGSYATRGMIIVPCSMSTLAAVATGYADNLLRRAADVTMKEHREMIIVPRETPLSSLHLEHLLTLSKRGAQIVPAMPGFYTQPRTVAELVDSFVMRLADHMGYKLNIAPRWPLEEESISTEEVPLLT
ncbi:MAG: UbiX family flavin prenyltransferase [Deltaproteobacteria bacterium]|nr:UbiX family flavin prenyltransferase [Deltaproteobacteria bacterium]